MLINGIKIFIAKRIVPTMRKTIIPNIHTPILKNKALILNGQGSYIFTNEFSQKQTLFPCQLAHLDKWIA